MKKILFSILFVIVLGVSAYCLNTGSSTAMTTAYAEVTFPVDGVMYLTYYAIDSGGDTVAFYIADDALGTNERFIGNLGITEPISVVDGTVFYAKLLSGTGTLNVFYSGR